MNIVLVPALLLLLGLVVYKKVIEPRKAGESKGAKTKPGKPGRKTKAKVVKAETVDVKPNKKADKKAVKARAGVGAGRMGSVL